LSIDPCVAFRLGVGSWSFTLPADDYRLVRDTRRIFTYRIAGPPRQQEPYLVHRVVERGSLRGPGRTGLQGCEGTRAFGCRGACTLSRGDRSRCIDAPYCASMSAAD